MNELERELMIAFKEEEERKKRKFNNIKLFGYFAIFIFLFAIYMFAVSFINADRVNPEYNKKAIEEQGALLYTFNLANPFINFGDINPLIWFVVILVFVLIIITTVFILIYSNLKKISKKENDEKILRDMSNTPDEFRLISMNLDNISSNNKKVLDLLIEGNRQIDHKQFSEARTTYGKISEWYEKENDKTKEIYRKIIKLYNRILKEEKDD
jgi:hypothetical protein